MSSNLQCNFRTMSWLTCKWIFKVFLWNFSFSWCIVIMQIKLIFWLTYSEIIYPNKPNWINIPLELLKSNSRGVMFGRWRCFVLYKNYSDVKIQGCHRELMFLIGQYTIKSSHLKLLVQFEPHFAGGIFGRFLYKNSSSFILIGQKECLPHIILVSD